MKYSWMKVLKVILPMLAVTFVFASCASWSGCNTDACYDRAISSVDPYRKGDVAAWGTEKEQAEKDYERERHSRMSSRHQ